MEHLVMTTSWCRPDSIWAQLGAQAPARDLGPLEIRREVERLRERDPESSIALTTGFLQAYPGMDFTGLEGVSLWLESGSELAEIFPLIERAVQKGLRVDFVFSRVPEGAELELLAGLPRESLRAICCFRVDLPLPIPSTEWAERFAEWWLWAPPAGRSAKAFLSGRELFLWRRRHPDLSKRLIFFTGESPHAPEAPLYLRDGVSDPLDFEGSSAFERTFLRALIRTRKASGSLWFGFLSLVADLLELAWRDRLRQLPVRGLHFFQASLWPRLIYPARKIYRFSRYQYVKRLRPRFFV